MPKEQKIDDKADQLNYYGNMQPFDQSQTEGMDTFSAAMARAHLAVAANFPHLQYGLPLSQLPQELTLDRFAQPEAPPVQEQQPQDGKYTCTLCDRSFSRLYNLKSHIKTHENQRPFECPECSQRFARNHDLNRHIRTHSQQRPHMCQVCGRQFARRDALKRHERMNPEGKKIHCIPDPERVFNAQNLNEMQQQQINHAQQAAITLQQHFDELSRLHPGEIPSHFDAASVISSLAMRDQSQDLMLTHEQAMQAVQALAQQQQQQDD